tara:strand:+ start:1001 stop:1162 length:162 start_codon:yes stop_codon:yes gene_type:complete
MSKQNKIDFIINERIIQENINPKDKAFIKYLRNEYLSMNNEELEIEFNFYMGE